MSDNDIFKDDFTNTELLIRNILISRGITTDTEIEKFLHPSIREYMPDPYVLQDMESATKIIADSIYNNEKIAVYGDYDVDGLTSTAILIKYFKSIGVDIIWHVPNREAEGYGLNNQAIENIAKSGANLLITVDCGISCIDQVNYAKQLGLKVVVTDHHSPDSVLPIADAIVNPKRSDDTSNLTYLAGVGVAFLLLVALNRELKNRNFFADKENINLLSYTDLVALGTVCDTMPLIELNRAFVATGLQILNLHQNLGIKTLMNVAGIKQATVYAIGFAIGPRINAAGRLDSPEPALELLLTDNSFIAEDLANKLNKMNQDRMDIQNVIMEDALIQAKESVIKNKKSLFVCGDNWHGGVMGIIAGRLKEVYNLPSCVATRTDGVINGSGRSIPEIDLGNIIHSALSAGILTEGGGHAAAAGFTLNVDKEQEFIEFLEKSVNEQLQNQSINLETTVDAEIDASGANMKLVTQLSALAPFGQSNPEPTLVLHGAVLKYATIMGNGNHVRGSVTTSTGTILNFVGFNLVQTAVGKFLLDDENTNTKILLLGKLKENEFNGKTTVQFCIEDIAL